MTDNARLIEMVSAQTLKAAATASLLARKLDVDLLLRLAGTTQIARAISIAGYRKDEETVLIVCGPAKDMKRFQESTTVLGERLHSSPLTAKERDAVERAAVLSTLRS